MKREEAGPKGKPKARWLAMSTEQIHRAQSGGNGESTMPCCKDLEILMEKLLGSEVIAANAC